MKIDKNIVGYVLLLHVAFGATDSDAQTATSTDNEALLEEIVVIGTRRKDRTVAESPVPIDVLSASDLQASGLTETNMLLNSLLPSFNFPQPSITDGTDHVRPAQLRGLAPDHTLVLINGKRRHASAMLNLNGSVGRGSTAVDLNMVPANAIKRIEVLRDGAAAQYGSDAIAGVINVVLNDAAEGFSVSTTYGQYDTELDGVPGLGGASIDGNGELVLAPGGDRSVTDGETLTVRGNIGLPLGTDGFFNAAIEYRDRSPTNRAGFDPRQNFPATTDGGADSRELSFNRINHRFGNADVQDLNLFFNAGVESGAYELYSFGSFGQREGESGGFYRRSRDSRNVVEIYPDGFLPLITSDLTDRSIAFGARREIGTWDSDFSFTYGQNDFEFGVINSLNTSLGPSSQTSFDAGTLINSQWVVNADFSRLLNLGGRSASLALGLEYRDENYEIEAGETASFQRGTFPGAAGSQVFPGFAPVSEIDDGRDSVSLYGELDADVTDQLNAAVALRFEDYSDFGSTVNGKLALRFAVSDAFALRGSVASGFRAPSLAQQFFTSIATVFVDGEPTETGTFRPDSAVAQALGSPGLDSEDSFSYGVGATFNADNGFNLTVDFYNIDIDDRIVLSENLSGDGVAMLLAGTGANRARFFLNGIDSQTQGVDVVGSYSFELNNGDTIDLVGGFNYSDNEVTRVLPPPAELASIGVTEGNLFARREIARFEDGAPETKLNLGATWRHNKLRANLRTTRFGDTVDPSSNPDNDELLDAEWITDLEVAYTFTDNLSGAFGSNNVFDVYPTASADFIRADGRNPGNFDRIFPYSGFSPFGFSGRYVYARINLDFQ